eukprot:TRINITY_DN6655_c0_g1_i2.p1 TRINITY_DN6655_c0_g1~~TRINITY_DN6655_c0_g1_i2.p1  ORF type:complete len:205 (-),score=52.09 TRINITY_DN6655_c0_g1_i2:468-1082(-)
MAAMTPMMAAIAAAKKAKQSSTGKASKTFTVGDLVQYWSDSKNKWINATVLERREESGSTLYDLDVRKGAKIDRVRERPDGPSKEIGKKAGGASGGVAVAATSGSPFASFDAFDMRQSKKRGRDDSDDDVCPASRAEAKASIDWSNPPEDLVPPLDETFVRSEEAAAFFGALHSLRSGRLVARIGGWRRLNRGCLVEPLGAKSF